jgi:hypothetical protein
MFLADQFLFTFLLLNSLIQIQLVSSESWKLRVLLEGRVLDTLKLFFIKFLIFCNVWVKIPVLKGRLDHIELWLSYMWSDLIQKVFSLFGECSEVFPLLKTSSLVDVVEASKSSCQNSLALSGKKFVLLI